MPLYKQIGTPHLHFKEVDSTNAVARRQIDQHSAPEGMLITADIQTHGRGQYGRTWISAERQNILMSVILKPTFLSISSQFDLNIAVSLAVADIISQFCPDTRIKWPNDIYVGDNKIAGILIQNFIQGQQIAHAIIGIGINVSQKEWPPEILNVTSLVREGLKEIKSDELIQILCDELEKRYNGLEENKDDFRKEYTNQLYRLHQTTSFFLNEQEQIGKILGVDEIGRLIIEQNNGIKAFNHGEIKLII